MADSPFIQNTIAEKSKERGNKRGKQNRQEGPAVHHYFHSFFKNGIGEKVMRLAKEHNEFPPKIKNKSIYLDFHIRGSCPKGSACHYSSSHSYIPSHEFCKLIQFSRGLLEKYLEIEKEEKPKLDKPKVKPTKPKAGKEDIKEEESKGLD